MANKEEVAKTAPAPPTPPDHKLRLSHNWDADEKGKNFVCVEGESLFFSPRALVNAHTESHGCRGCGAKVPTKVYAEQRGRWTEKGSPQAWVVDKVLNEVLAPCACRRCERKRRQNANYKGLTAKGLKETTPASA